MGSGEDNDCHNIDECKLQIHSCGEKGDKGTYCQDNDGSYDCFCLHGFHMAESGRCENTNECLEGLVLEIMHICEILTNYPESEFKRIFESTDVWAYRFS